MSIRGALATASALMLATPGISQEIIRLSPAEREAALDAAAQNDPINGAPGLGDGKVHGEMGIVVGSNGERAVYGSTLVPLGGNATLGLGFFKAQGGTPRGR